jgi:hypothetical protein
VIRADTGNLKLPAGFGDEEDGTPWWRPGLVMLIVTLLSLAFIAAIAWLVATQSVWKPGEGWRVRVSE